MRQLMTSVLIYIGKLYKIYVELKKPTTFQVDVPTTCKGKVDKKKLLSKTLKLLEQNIKIK